MTIRQRTHGILTTRRKLSDGGESTTDEMNVVLVHCQTPHPGDELKVLWDVAMQQPAWVQVGVGGGRR